jgi:hypothetical protein
MSGINCARNPMDNWNLNESKVRQLSPNVSAVDFVKDTKGNFKTCEAPTGKANELIGCMKNNIYLIKRHQPQGIGATKRLSYK